MNNLQDVLKALDYLIKQCEEKEDKFKEKGWDQGFDREFAKDVAFTNAKALILSKSYLKRVLDECEKDGVEK